MLYCWQWAPFLPSHICICVSSVPAIHSPLVHVPTFAEMAKDHLADHGVEVVGGFVSPVNDAYQKPGLIPASHRIEMCRAALKDHAWVQVDCWESEQPVWQTTVQVLGSLSDRLGQAGFPDVRVMLVSGADLVYSFQVPNLWALQDQERIARDHGLVVIERTGTDLSEHLLINSALFAHRVPPPYGVRAVV